MNRKALKADYSNHLLKKGFSPAYVRWQLKYIKKMERRERKAQKDGHIRLAESYTRHIMQRLTLHIHSGLNP